jgi:adenylate cyclase
MKHALAKPYSRIANWMGWLIVVANGMGAILVSIYFSMIAPTPEGESAVVQATFAQMIPSLVATGVLLAAGTIMMRAADRFHKKWALHLEAGGDPSLVPDEAKREVLNYVPWVAVTSLTMWLIAGVFFSGDFENWNPQGFFGTFAVGGILTCGLVFFASEVIWRPMIPMFFPHGIPRSLKAFRLNVMGRLLIVFLLSSIYPIGMLSYIAIERAGMMLIAPNPETILQNLIVAVVFVLIVALATSAGLAILVTRLIVHPIDTLQEAMERVEQNDLDINLPVYSNDELGYLTERFNAMVVGLKRAEQLRNLLNVYVSPEVARAAIEQGASLGGQVVDCSVLFSDIRGFTAISEQMPPDRLIEMLNRYMTAMVEVIIRHGGMVNKFGGDSLLAVFGTPLNPSADHSGQAVRAAIGMREALAQFNESQKQINAPELQIGIGIATGEVVAGNIGGKGRIEYTVIGDTVNLASRLQSLTKELHRDILLNDTAFNLSKGKLSFNVEALPPVDVRGKQEPVNVFAIL